MLWCKGKRQALCCDVGNREQVLCCGVCGFSPDRIWFAGCQMHPGFYREVTSLQPGFPHGCRIIPHCKILFMVAELINTVKFSSRLQN